MFILIRYRMTLYEAMDTFCRMLLICYHHTMVPWKLVHFLFDFNREISAFLFQLLRVRGVGLGLG